MNKSVLKLCLILTVVMGLATQANASLHTSLTVGDANYLGSIDDGIPSSENNEVFFINNLGTLAAGQGDTVIPGPNAQTTETYNRQGSSLVGPFPTAVTTDSMKDETGGNTFDLGLMTFQYILAKAGNVPSVVWFSAAGFSGVIEVPSDLGGTGGGLSHVSFYNKGIIPEPTTMLVWGGLGAMAISFARRWRTRR